MPKSKKELRAWLNEQLDKERRRHRRAEVALYVHYNAEWDALDAVEEARKAECVALGDIRPAMQFE